MLEIGQYESYFFLYIMAVLLIPAVILSFLEKSTKIYSVLLTIVMIVIILGDTRSIAMIGIFIIWHMGNILIYRNIREKNSSVWVYRFFLALSILPLAISKLSGLFETKVIGFVGISYLSFRAIQMIIEIYDGAIDDVNVLDTFYFILFFPTLTSGPIDRSRRFEEEINSKVSREEYIGEYFIPGIYKIVMGIVYKFVIATIINNYWVTQIILHKGWSSLLLYMYGYSFYLFFDFAGYTFFAIGTAKLLKVSPPENFNKPFISKDIKEFWTRWHISLSRWFGDYIFSRFVLDSMRKKRFKNRNTASHVAQMITMTTMGIWHGLTWYYIIYGIYHGILLVLTDIYQKKSKFYKKHKKNKVYGYVSMFVTFHIVCFGFLIFSGYFAK